jgi:hypothetical protein
MSISVFNIGCSYRLMISVISVDDIGHFGGISVTDIGHIGDVGCRSAIPVPLHRLHIL